MGRYGCLGSRCARRGGNFGEFIRKDEFWIFDGSFSLQLGGPGAIQHGRHHGPHGGRQGLSKDYSGSDPLDASRKDSPFFERNKKKKKRNEKVQTRASLGISFHRVASID